MASLSTASAGKKIDKNAIALKNINDAWKGNTVEAANAAAFDIGRLVAASMLAYHKAKDNVLRGFEVRLVDNKWRSTVYEALESGRSSLATTPEMHAQFCAPVAGNDNTSTALPVIDPRDWQGKPVPERRWFVEGWIPHRTVTNLSGDGGSGKTEIILQLIAASSLRMPWFGKEVSPGPCLYYGAEEEADEPHRRLEMVVRHAGKQLSELDGIRLIPMAGLDAVLVEPDRTGTLAVTDIFPKLVSQASTPTQADSDRPLCRRVRWGRNQSSQVRKFVSMLRGLAMNIDCAVLLISHPSLAGMSSGTGTR
jgi:RecA-family ATPase